MHALAYGVGALGERLGFPADAVTELQCQAERAGADSAFMAELSRWQQLLPEKEWPASEERDALLSPWAQALGMPPETLALLALLSACPGLKAAYGRRGIPADIYWDGLSDFRSKLLECRELRGINGTFVPGWFQGLFRLQRFGIGRFQYNMETLEKDYPLPDGRVIPAGAFKVGCHIPSHGSALTDAVRMDSYRRAHQFFAPRLYQGLLIVSCSSWLMYPAHPQFLPKDSRVLRFMSDFDLIGQKEQEGFPDGWRVFGRAWGAPYAALPEDTSLQRAYKQWLLQRGVTGRGFGLMVFDGERIINPHP